MVTCPPLRSRTYHVRLAIVAALGSVLAAGCAGPEQPAATCRTAPGASRPNLLVVTICSLRFDHTSVAGYERSTTPWLATLARDGVVFEQMVAASSWTKPATASILTGTTPLVHGLFDFYRREDVIAGRVPPKRALPADFLTLPECLAEAGYDTFGRINNIHAGDVFGLTQGLADVEVEHGMPAAAMLDDLQTWLMARSDTRPFFGWLFTRDVHTPYAPEADAYARFARHPVEADFAAQRATITQVVREHTAAGERVPVARQEQWIDLYDAALVELDATLQRIPALLSATGHGQDTIVLVTADHGERFFERGQIGHGGRLDEAVLRVPLIIRGPGIARGRRSQRVVRSIDLYPTILDVAGVETDLPLQGVSLAAVARGQAADPPSRSAYATQGEGHVLRHGPYKLHARAKRTTLHHLPTDPDERTDLSTAQGERTLALQRELASWVEGSRRLAERHGQAVERPLPPDVVDQLRALGYLD